MTKEIDHGPTIMGEEGPVVRLIERIWDDGGRSWEVYLVKGGLNAVRRTWDHDAGAWRTVLIDGDVEEDDLTQDGAFDERPTIEQIGTLLKRSGRVPDGTALFTAGQIAFDALDQHDGSALLSEIFGELEYGDDGSRSDADTVQAITDAFARYGIRFTYPNVDPQ